MLKFAIFAALREAMAALREAMTFYECIFVEYLCALSNTVCYCLIAKTCGLSSPFDQP
jgi:hypothetical protein